MTWRIIKIVLIAAVIVLILLWLWGGGFSSTAQFVRTIPNPLDIIFGNSTSTYAITFPWQMSPPHGPDISGLTQAGSETLGQSAQDQPSDSPDQSIRVEAQVQNSRTYGTPSPYAGKVILSEENATENSVNDEYVGLSVRGNTAVNLSGWSLQSVLSGLRAFIPPATSSFVLGQVNSLSSVTLGPEESAVVATGPSPIGVSFRENRCTGYLAQLQTFNPSLQNACPASSEMAPLTAENLRHYGNDCMDYVRSLPQCFFPTSLPSSLTPGCRAFIVNTFSYNGCVNAVRGSSSFALDTWRLYLSSAGELWNNTHDIIRLLDGNGLTVDAISY
jgi:hypothetical protein